MFIIFCWEKTVNPLESILKNNCYHCRNHSSWSIWKESEWLSLFFIKVFPFNSKYHLGCDVCGDAIPLSTCQAKDSLNSSKRTHSLYNQLILSIESHQFSNLTEGQIIYRKAQFENR